MGCLPAGTDADDLGYRSQLGCYMLDEGLPAKGQEAFVRAHAPALTAGEYQGV
jgi:hypothetical protein